MTRFDDPYAAPLFAQAASPTPEQELNALLVLHFTPGLGSRSMAKLLEHFGTGCRALAASEAELRAIGLRSAILQEWNSSKAHAHADREQQQLHRLQASGVEARLISHLSPDYPAAFAALSDAPALLWVRGPLPHLSEMPFSVGMVGTRNASHHALQLTGRISHDLAAAGVVVVSGLARGIDTAAHQAALAAGGLTLAVVGTGIDRVYPSENAALAAKLTVMSEFSLGTQPRAHHFPQRNRLVAALSAGVVVVEGELKSGSLITAAQALECGRTVFAVPGLAGDPRAAGPHRLLREGAVLTESAADIFEEMRWTLGTVGVSSPSPAPVSVVSPVPVKMTPQLGEHESRIWQALQKGPLEAGDLAALVNLGYGEVQMALLNLQIGGHAEESGGRWRLLG